MMIKPAGGALHPQRGRFFRFRAEDNYAVRGGSTCGWPITPAERSIFSSTPRPAAEDNYAIRGGYLRVAHYTHGELRTVEPSGARGAPGPWVVNSGGTRSALVMTVADWRREPPKTTLEYTRKP